jgi:excisionase family DNA binding protein
MGGAVTVAMARSGAGPLLVAPDGGQGQVFADLLFLAAMSCRAPITLISVPQADGQWSTLSHGVDRRDGLNDPRLFSAVAAAAEPLEIRDLADHDPLGHGPLATGPLGIRFLYGSALRGPDGNLAGVLCALDRTTRDIGRREQQAMQVIARQVTAQLLHLRKGAGPAAVATALHSPGRARHRDHTRANETLAELVGLRGSGLATEPQLLRSHEVAVLFDVTERTVINWAASGKLASLRTAGGHLRFRSKDVMALLDNRAGSATG